MNSDLGYNFPPKRNIPKEKDKSDVDSHMEERIKTYKEILMIGANKLNIPQYVCTQGMKYLVKMVKKIQIGCDPRGYAGGCLYVACKEASKKDKKVRRTQKEVGRSVGMTDITIRNRTKELESILEMESKI